MSAPPRPRPGLGGCETLPFNPESEGQLGTDRAASPTGFDFEFAISESEGLTNPKLIAPLPAKKAVVALPEGITINPSLAAGLGVCTPGRSTKPRRPPRRPAPVARTPRRSATSPSQSPLFAEPIAGSLFLAAPHREPLRHPARPLHRRQGARSAGSSSRSPASSNADPTPGSWSATFDDLPQLPYSHFDVHFREGQRAPLVSPPACGTYATQTDLTPWLDARRGARARPPVAVAAGPEGGPCPAGSAALPPQARAGTINSNAGSYSPFYLHLTRTDAEAGDHLLLGQAAAGLLGKIAGIPYCPEATSKRPSGTSGVAETEHPTCPAASQIGHTSPATASARCSPTRPGGLYLAGPFHGSPFSIVAIDAATVGPFDLGTIVDPLGDRGRPTRRPRSRVDSAGSDPIPHILDGIPLHLRDIRVYIDRPDFTLNPTSCDPFSRRPRP